ncbi:MAG: HD-GYP domain-containing protein, partial [Candidatus Gastranaerophilaceae bacterium]
SLILKKDGYDVITCSDAKIVRKVVIEEKPNLLLMDISMPDINGFDLCERLKKDKDIEDIPIIFVSALDSPSDIAEGFEKGAVDYITKPYRAEEVRARVATHIKLHRLQVELEEKNKNLEKIVEEQVKLISETQMETIFSLAKLAQSRDDETGKHLERVQKYCYVLSVELAKNSPYKDIIDKKFIKDIVYASPLHDIGKVAIPDAILLKPGKLTPEEYDIMKLHTLYGAETLEDVHKKFGANQFIAMGRDIAKYHHERWDGRGYLEGLKDVEIPLSARIMAIADVYDAIVSKRVYKEPLSHEKCVEIIKKARGTQFDPYIVDAFVTVNGEFDKIRKNFEDKILL